MQPSGSAQQQVNGAEMFAALMLLALMAIGPFVLDNWLRNRVGHAGALVGLAILSVGVAGALDKLPWTWRAKPCGLIAVFGLLVTVINLAQPDPNSASYRAQLARDERERAAALEEERRKQESAKHGRIAALRKDIAGTKETDIYQLKIDYEDLMHLLPEDEEVKAKFHEYADEIFHREWRERQRKELLANPAPSLNLLSTSAYKGGFGTVQVATFKIQNPLSFSVKDIGVSCSVVGRSGTVLGTLSQTIYDVLPPGKTKTFSNINMGFIDGQSSGYSCRLVSAAAL